MTLWCVSRQKTLDFPLPGQCRCCLVETFKCHLLVLAQVGFAQLSLVPMVDIPVPSVALSLATHSEGPKRGPKRKRPMPFFCQPAVSGIRSNENRRKQLSCFIRED